MLKDIRKNPLMLTDVYNLSHQRLKVNTDFEVSHIYNRSEGMILYGLQEMVTDILSRQITFEMIDEAEMYANQMGLVFPRKMFERMVKECNGYFPLKVEMLPEGVWCPSKTPFAQIRNTVEGYGEMVTWLEGVLMHSYFPSGCATESFHMRRYLESKMKEHGFDESFLIRFHSFGFRGHRSLEDAYWSGTAWNLFLKGTDDFHTKMHTPNAQIGSIPALAHKVTQQYDDEYECFKNAIDVAVEDGCNIVALVIDTYDAWRVINKYTLPLSEYAKSKGVHIVMRPDSGDTWKQAVAIYRIVKENNLTNVTVIIGESMSFENCKKADKYFEENGVPLNFIAYGIGAGFYKHIERDTHGHAMKTAFSNASPRMKVVKSEPFKQSIPNMVHLGVNEEGDLTVYNGDGLGYYKVVYNYQEGDALPSYEIPNWNETQETALLWLSEEDLQQTIVLSDETEQLIEEITRKYE